jgi:hypothetical protein
MWEERGIKILEEVALEHEGLLLIGRTQDGAFIGAHKTDHRFRSNGLVRQESFTVRRDDDLPVRVFACLEDMPNQARESADDLLVQ